MTSVTEALRAARERFGEADTAALDAELLLAHALGRSRTWLRAWPERQLDPDPRDRYEALVARRAAGEPVAYLLGRREFWSLELEVSPAVLIPRPETELLVEAVLDALRERQGPRVLDLGAGSGCIALALARERPDAVVVGVESSAEALAVARRNAGRLGLHHVEFLQGDWLASVGDARFDAIVSNPPYVPSDDPHLQQGDLRFEPAAALDGGPGGLDAIRAIVSAAPRHLAAGGLLALEHGHDQGEAVAGLLRARGLEAITLHADAAGLDRVTTATLADRGRPQA